MYVCIYTYIFGCLNHTITLKLKHLVIIAEQNNSPTRRLTLWRSFPFAGGLSKMEFGDRLYLFIDVITNFIQISLLTEAEGGTSSQMVMYNAE